MVIGRLGSRDRFNVIEFNSTAVKLFDHSMVPDGKNREKAIGFVRSLEVGGGTEITESLKLVIDGQKSHTRIRQIMFLTDGSVGNEEELLEMLEVSGRMGIHHWQEKARLAGDI